LSYAVALAIGPDRYRAQAVPAVQFTVDGNGRERYMAYYRFLIDGNERDGQSPCIPQYINDRDLRLAAVRRILKRG
jgi:hypothetical protein